MARKLQVEKLSDEFGLYELQISCGGCGHVRRAVPRTLARICGWDIELSALAKRMRCSKCQKKHCTVQAVAPARR